MQERKKKKKKKKSSTVAVGHLQIFVVGRDGPCNPKVEDRREGVMLLQLSTLPLHLILLPLFGL